MIRRWHFTSEAPAIGEARRCVADALADQPQRLVEVAMLLVSELATNAVCHARSAFDVGLRRGSDLVRVEVSDAGPGDPVVRSPGPTDASGRGLQIVDRLADEWGVVHHQGHDKTIWFILNLDGRGASGERTVHHPVGAFSRREAHGRARR